MTILFTYDLKSFQQCKMRLLIIAFLLLNVVLYTSRVEGKSINKVANKVLGAVKDFASMFGKRGDDDSLDRETRNYDEENEA